MPRSGTAGPYESSIFDFSRSLHAAVRRGCTSLQSHQRGTRVPFPPRPRQHSFVDLLTAILAGVRWYPLRVSICVSLMTSDVGHLFMMSAGHLCAPYGEMSTQVLGPLFVIGLIVFSVLSSMRALYILDIAPLFCEFLPPFSRLSFRVVDGFLTGANTFLVGCLLTCLFFILSLAWGDLCKKLLLRAMTKSFPPVFSPRSFRVWFWVLHPRL